MNEQRFVEYSLENATQNKQKITYPSIQPIWAMVHTSHTHVFLLFVYGMYMYGYHI